MKDLHLLFWEKGRSAPAASWEAAASASMAAAELDRRKRLRSNCILQKKKLGRKKNFFT